MLLGSLIHTDKILMMVIVFRLYKNVPMPVKESTKQVKENLKQMIIDVRQKILVSTSTYYYALKGFDLAIILKVL